MGAWADGLAANSKKQKQREENRNKEKAMFSQKYSDLWKSIEEMAEGTTKLRLYSTNELILLCMRQFLLNQYSILEDSTSMKSMRIAETQTLLDILEKTLLEDNKNG